MKKKLTAITLATTMVLGNSFFGMVSHAESGKDLHNIQAERSDIQANLSATEEKMNGIISDMESLNQEIQKVGQVLTEKQALVDQTTEDINYTTEEINQLQEEIHELEKSIEKRYNILKNRASSYQLSGGSVNYLEVIFGSESFGDFISRVSTVNKIVESDAALMEQLDRDIQKVEENQKLSMDKLNELNVMKAEHEEALLVVQEQKAKSENSKNALAEKQGQLQGLVTELKSKDRNLAFLEEDVKQKIVAAEEKAKEVSKQQNKKVVVTSTDSNSSKSSTSSKPEVEEKATETSASSKPKTEQKNTVEKTTEKKVEKEKKTLTVNATAYTLESAGGSGKTYTGIDLRKNPNAKVIAVDPKVIPLGSVVHVEGYGYAIAGDIGSAIKGNKIDVYVPTHQAAVNWGFRTVKITIQ
ncbi:3D domain-containing protein [Oceanobacillus sp. Castelsardo]|uniref:PcsB-like coiled-coil domain-containing protein n=1 Tax=Oceanobacillus sp. Castelsardo TaxID=1851204 RepID=UPI0008394ECA|nr:3D domain-containing protein [Oceanobacillus sp. Castelsardo]